MRVQWITGVVRVGHSVSLITLLTMNEELAATDRTDVCVLVPDVCRPL